MPDSYGAPAIPLTAPGAGLSAEPLLDYLGQYIKACLNAHAQDAWSSLGAGRGSIVNVYQTNNPNGAEFKPTELPALYVWEDEQATRYERIADDIQVKISQIHIVWVPPPGQQTKQKQWDSLLISVGKVIDYALVNGRDPAWVKTGDPDAQAATRGSVLIRHAGLMQDLRLSRSRRVPIAIEMSDGSPAKKYQAVHCMVETHEQLDASSAPRLQREPAAMRTEIENEEGTVMVTRQG